MSDQQTTSEKTRWTQAELLDEARARFGDDPLDWAFRCPRCGDVATARDFKNAGGEGECVGQECVGRWLGALSGPPTKDGMNRVGRGCDWTAYGLFGGPWTIVLPATADRPECEVGGFPLATAAEVAAAIESPAAVA